MTDTEFLVAFEATTLPREAWTHEAHVRMAYLYLREMGLDRALPVVCEGIRHYNASQGNHTGYHDTITVAFLHLIANCLSAEDGLVTWDVFRDAHPDLMQRRVLLYYYSGPLLFSEEARAGFVKPDLAPLPGLLPQFEAAPAES